MKKMNEYFEGDLTRLFYLNEYDSFEPCTNYHIENKAHENIYYCHPYLCFGDYDNSCDVERSNHRVFMEMFGSDKDVLERFYSYGAEYIYIRSTAENNEIIECLEALENYPAIDDQDVSLMNIEMFEESWENWIRSDFENMVLNHFDLCDIEYEDSDLLEWFKQLTERANIYFEVESGGNGWIDLDRIEFDELPGNFKAIEWN